MKLPSTADLARASAAHPWRAIAAWVLILVLAVGTMGVLGMRTTSDISFTNNPEAQHGMRILDRAGLSDDNPTDETVVIQSDRLTVNDPAFQQRVEDVTAKLRTMDGVVLPDTVVNYYELAANPKTADMAKGMVSKDGRTTLIPLTLAGDADQAIENAPAYEDTLSTFAGDGFEIISVGYTSIGQENNTIAEKDLAQAETFGIGAALVVLVFVFGALVAAGVPILLAVVAIVASFGLTAALSHVWDLSFFITNMITMIGLAVGIDYALFVIERYREERRNGQSRREAIATMGGTAGKAVAFSGGTVVLALSGMFLLPASIFQALAAGAVMVVVFAMLATMTLIPAVLSLLGDRIDWPRRRDYDAYHASHLEERHHGADTIYTGFWGRIVRGVTRRPVVAAIAAVLLLVTASIPYWDIQTGFAGVETMPKDSEVRHGFEILDREFSAGELAPVQFAIVGDRDQVSSGIETLRSDLATMTVPGHPDEKAFLPIPAGEPATWNADGTVALVQATLTHASNDERSYDTIDALRNDVVPAAFAGTDAKVYVTGETAFNLDFFHLVNTYQPIIVGFVLVLSFLLLLLAFRSIVVSTTAIVLNLLSVGAAYGLLVLVFQKGVGNELFGLQHTPTIEAWLPIFLFCVLFGLSMDYHVFLLSRIREHYDETRNNREAVAVGLKSTGRIITGAALIMVAVFAGFASGRLIMLQQMGFGLGVAVLIDATIVRSVLVPSVMSLLGDWNWYLPRWLSWLPDLRIEGAPAPSPARPVIDTPLGIEPPAPSFGGGE
jgi:RND superfamily putative drug exporter